MDAIIRKIMQDNPGVSEEQVVQYLMSRFDREYPSTFRSMLDDTEVEQCPGEVELKVRCHCGECALTVQIKGLSRKLPSAIRCHCQACRRFHASAFGAFVSVSADGVSGGWDFGGRARKHRETCGAIGEVDRVFCGKCFAKLVTLPLSATHAQDALLALGVVEDSSVPAALGKHWQSNFEEWQGSFRATWWTAVACPQQGSPR